MKIVFQLTRALIMISLLSSTALMAEVYRWVDDAGQVHYGDKKPAESQSEVVRTVPNVMGGENVPTAKDMQTDDAKLDASQQATAGASEKAKLSPEVCDRLRTRIQKFANAPRVFLQDKQQWLVDKDLDAEREKMRTLVAEGCS